jgi:hypothetical protein
MAEIQRLARQEHLTVGEWVRQALRDVSERKPINDVETKLRAVRRGAEHAFPTGEIEQMLREIERGYQS